MRKYISLTPLTKFFLLLAILLLIIGISIHDAQRGISAADFVRHPEETIAKLSEMVDEAVTTTDPQKREQLVDSYNQTIESIDDYAEFQRLGTALPKRLEVKVIKTN